MDLHQITQIASQCGQLYMLSKTQWLFDEQRAPFAQTGKQWVPYVSPVIQRGPL